MTGRPQQFSALRRAFGRALDWFMGKEAVGKDASGNVYYRWYEGSGPVKVERREVQWQSAYMYYDPDDIPSEWRMWLRKLREEPPTDEEMQQNAAKQAVYRARVAAVEERERLRKLRQQTVGTSDQHAGSQPDMARFLQQMRAQGAGGAPGTGQAAGGATSTPSASQPRPATPGSEQPGAAPGGQPAGEAFKPESWRPGA